ncbi:MAG: hypothetical protein R3D66_04640 [Alphaproteobacteria bacterium]
MTAIGGGLPNFAFNKNIFSDPNMRPHLETLYHSKYTPIRKRIEDMKEAEAKQKAPNIVRTRDEIVGTELSASQYESVIPSFDKWLDIQQNVVSPFDFAEQSQSRFKYAQQSLAEIKNTLDPDHPSDVKTVFSDGAQILGYINGDSTLVFHEKGNALQKIITQANQLNLTGETKIAYLREHGAAELSRHYSNLHVIDYSDENVPTKREFLQKWYPNHNIDASYDSMLKDAGAFLEQQEALYKQQIQNLYEMRAFLIQSMEEAQNAQKTVSTEPEPSIQTKGDAVKDFMAFMEMSPEERYIAQALADKGYTQEEFDALPPEEQQKIMDEIRQELREKIEAKTKSGDVKDAAGMAVS